jgi:mitochondrial intermediate peptidase
LYDALKASVKKGDSGDEHVAELFLFDFEQSAIHLDDAPRKRVVHLNDLILQTGQRFMAGAATPRQIPRSDLPASIRSKYFLLYLFMSHFFSEL